VLHLRKPFVSVFVVVLIVLGTPIHASADDLTGGQWYVAYLDLAVAHGVSTGSGITVAVIDSGVDASHVDLKGRVLSGADFSLGGPTSTGNGRVDTSGHGTQMAGLVVGRGKVNGVAPAARVLPVRDHASADSGTAGRLSEGIRWAVEHGARVVSISSGGDGDLLLKQAVVDALAKDVVLVAAAGNTSQRTAIGYPAAYPGVIAACGVDRDGNHSSISVTGPALVLCAPSDGISSTLPGGRYAIGTGTSESTALIAGAAALVRAKFPQLSAAEVVHRLTATATDKGTPGRDDVYGFGVVNIVDALTKNVPPLTPSAASSSVSQPSAAETDEPDGLANSIQPWHVALAGVCCLATLALLGGLAGYLIVRRRRR
jgi:type VII secretion-associated serine protease mycosin